MICIKKFFCCTCEKEFKFEEAIYDKLARQEYCAFCGWPWKFTQSAIWS